MLRMYVRLVPPLEMVWVPLVRVGVRPHPIVLAAALAPPAAEVAAEAHWAPVTAAPTRTTAVATAISADRGRGSLAWDMGASRQRVGGAVSQGWRRRTGATP